jgi:hypothetical protein
MPKTIFISCGQYTFAEKQLGKQISELVSAITDCVPYFAEQVQDLNGLDANILSALHECVGFITVMHPRGEIKRPDGSIVRASVWIEQEIAIATYIQRVEKRTLPIIAFKHKSVGREGIRDLLHLNPIEFSEETEILAELPHRLALWKSLKLPEQLAPPTPLAPASPKPRPNLCVEAIKLGDIYLEGEIWTLRPTVLGGHTKNRPALLADISNVPNDDTRTVKAAMRAAIRMGSGESMQRTYSPLPWLDEYTNLVYLETGARKTVVLAVCESSSKTGNWGFVLNHRGNYESSNRVSEMDWTNSCPLPSNLPFEILMMDVNSGELLAKFAYIWTFDVENNRPFLRNVV